MTKSPLKLLFIRLDKIGDLVCTLPCDEHPELAQTEKFWIIQKGNEFILENSLPERKFLSLDKSNPKESQEKLSTFLKENQFDAAFSFQSPWWVNWALFKAKIPHRFGVLSQWHSFLFLNQGLRQKRSQAEKHEADYNFEIVTMGLNKLLGNNIESLTAAKTPVLRMQAPENSSLLSKWNLTPSFYFVVHPGMAGSALNWQQKQYIEFIQSYLQKFSDKDIVITGTPMDEEYLKDIKAYFSENKKVKVLQNQINTRELLTVLKNSCGILAPSTGVLHLAASMGVPCYGIYSPIKVQHPKRWSVRGEKINIFLPDSVSQNQKTDCPATFKCLKENCPKYDCMKDISPSKILASIN